MSLSFEFWVGFDIESKKVRLFPEEDIKAMRANVDKLGLHEKVLRKKH